MRTKAIVFEEKGKAVVREATLVPCGPDHIVADTLYTFVSTGTEIRVFNGHYGAAGRYPLVPGYAGVARVVQVGDQVKGYREGDLVSVRNGLPFADINSHWGGQAARHVFPTRGEDRPVLLPAGAEPLDYIIAEVAAISLRGVDAADARPGESALVVGQGVIGSFAEEFLRLRGCRTVVCDLVQSRLDEALARGAFAAVNVSGKDAEERLAAIGNGGFDVVVEASGSIPGVELAFRSVRRKPQNYGREYKVEPITFYQNDWPRLVMQANYLDTVTINPFGFFAGEGVTILAPGDRGVEERQRVVGYLHAGKVSARAYSRNVFTPEQMPEAYARLQDRAILSAVCRWA